jgi:membrane protein
VPETALLLHIVNIVVSFLLIAALFAVIYKVLPDEHVTWADVGIGALVTSFLFTIGKFAIGLYIGSSRIGSSYGAASALVVILLWIYYSAQIFLLGAEFTKVFARRHQP